MCSCELYNYTYMVAQWYHVSMYFVPFLTPRPPQLSACMYLYALTQLNAAHVQTNWQLSLIPLYYQLAIIINPLVLIL